MNRRVVAALLASLLFTVPGGPSLRADAPAYTVEDLGTTADGLVPTVTGMNASGQVSGYVMLDDGTPRAVRYTNGSWTYVPGLQFSYGAATAINASGDLTGYYFSMAGLRAFRYGDVSGLTTISLLSASGSFMGVGFAIAANGDVVGYDYTGDGTRVWRAASPGLVPVVPSNLVGVSATACGLNEGGQVVGSFVTGAGYQQAFRLEADGSVTDLGTLDPSSDTSSSTACAIDVDGRVGGSSSLGDVTHAFLSSSGPLVDIDSFGSTFSTAEAISNGVSVGTFVSSTGGQHALVHTDVDGTSDLNDHLPSGSGWVLVDATAVNASGQIAGQGLFGGNPKAFRLTPAASGDTTAPTITSLSATPSSVTPPNHTMVAVAVSATATDNQDPNPVCTVSSIDGHGAPAADYSITGPLAGSVRATGGATYSFTVTCTDAAANAGSSSVDVVVPPDTTAPVFTSLTATPPSIWPPKGQTVTVTTAAAATDDSGDAPTCTLASITGPGSSPADFNVTGANTGTVKAVGGRTYTFNETCVDGSGNSASSSVNVTVPPDVTAPLIGSLTATPSSVSPPNHAMVPVTVSVSATDDVDDAPVCALSSITGGGLADSAINGPFSASVRAVGGRTYSLHVTCADAAGNAANGSVDVLVAPDTTAPMIASLTATPSRISPPNGALVPVTVVVRASDDSGEAPSCALSAITGSGVTANDYSITGQYSALVRATGGRTYSLRVTCSDAAGNPANRSVDVLVLADTTAPVIGSVTATPSRVWPPNGALVPVTVAVRASDDSGEAPACALSAIRSSGGTADDYSITGQFSARVRAVSGRTYSLGVTCRDAAGNRSDASVNVVVPADTTAPTITALSVSPDHIWPPNSKMVSVTVFVSATDDVDAAPTCALTSITGAPAADAVITGPFTANVRANKDAAYTLHVGCGDRAGNWTQAAVSVEVSKDPPVATAVKGKK